MKIAMIGTGYVGLVSGACFSEFGVDTVCVDKDAAKIARLLKNEIPIYEPGLEALVTKNATAGQVKSFSCDLATGGGRAPMPSSSPSARRRGVAMAMPTLPMSSRRRGKLRRHLAHGYTVIVTKSTVPVGTAREVERVMREANPQAEFDVCSNPEFLREGSAIGDFCGRTAWCWGYGIDAREGGDAHLYRPLVSD